MAVQYVTTITLLLLFLYEFSPVHTHEDPTASNCDWRARSNFYAIKAILENKVQSNDTLLYELAGIFSNKQRPLKQVIVHYSILIPLSDEDCDHNDLHCNLQYDDSINTGRDCPQGYRCISVDFMWGRYPATAQDIVFRDLDVCPLVIGDYEQREVTIHFTLKSPPSCNMSEVDDDTINREEFPCGWQCDALRTINPFSGDPGEAIVKAVDRESPLNRALIGITAKLLQYSTDKEALPSLQYDLSDARGYAARLNDATYFNPSAEYGIFLSAYILLHLLIVMLMYNYRSEIYNWIYKYVTENHVNFSLFWSSIITFFLFCLNISLVFAVEGGVCITLLQLYIILISLAPGLFYPVIAVFMISRELGFFDTASEPKQKACVKLSCLDHFIQILVMWFIYLLPHILVLIFFLASVSFFHNSNGTAFLGLYFASSSVVLWIANAIVIYLISPYFFIFRCDKKLMSKAGKHIVFAICLGLSLNLMNLSVMPFVGDFFYDQRADGSTIYSIIPIVITAVGWYLSGDLVEGFTALSFDNDPKDEQNRNRTKSLADLFLLKPLKKDKNTTETLVEEERQSDGMTNQVPNEPAGVREGVAEGQRDTFPKLRRIANAVKYLKQASVDLASDHATSTGNVSQSQDDRVGSTSGHETSEV